MKKATQDVFLKSPPNVHGTASVLLINPNKGQGADMVKVNESLLSHTVKTQDPQRDDKGFAAYYLNGGAVDAVYCQKVSR